MMGAEPSPAGQPPDLPSLCLAITEHAPLPIATVDGATHIVRYANPAFCLLMNQPLERLVGRPLHELLPARDECVPLLDRVFRTGKPERHTEKEEAKPHPVFWSYTMWPVQADEHFVGIMIQITETAHFHETSLALNEALLLGSVRQHELTDAAENLNARLREQITARESISTELLQKARDLAEKARLLDLTHDAIIVRDMEGHVRYWNHGAEELYGWSREEALGKVSHLLLQTEFPIPLEQMTAELHRTDRWIGELVHTARDGRRLTVLARKTLDRDSEGHPVAVLENLTDITARKQFEEALRESEARFRAAVGLISSLIWTNNAEGMMEGEQPGWGNFTGQSEAEYQGYGWARAVHEEDAQPTIDAWEKAVAEKRMFEYEHRVRRRDGEWRLCSIRAVPLLRDDGTIREWLGVHTDITERNKGEEARARLAAIVESSDDAIISKNLEGIITSWNAGAERLFGYTAREIVGHSVTVLIPPERLSEEANILGHIRRGEPLEHFETVRRRKDGTLFDVSLTVSPILDGAGKIVGASKIARDITASKRAAETLRASEERYRSILDSSPDCINVLDLEGNLLSIEAGQELLGITDLAPLLGTSWIEFWKDAEHRAAAHTAVAAAAAGGEGHFVGFFRTLHGLEKWWDVAVMPVSDVRGQPARLLAVSRDVTERHDMEGMLVARAAELAKADRSKDEFLAMLAHELRNPLAPLRSATEILRTPGATAEATELAVGILSRQIENMSEMIGDLLDVSRITEGKIELRPRVVALEAVLNAAASLARPGIEARGQELTIALPAEPVFLNADATRLDQVFGNLLTNACKYSGSGCHISISAERVEPRGQEPPEVIVRVRDDGIGIAPELLPRIFDLFVQATRSLDRASGGLGIGLTLVQRLVKLHGGTVEARSEGLGHGSEFIVRLPILTAAAAPAPPPVAPAHDIPRRILIVDDNQDSARGMATLQGLRGHATRTAFTGPDAVVAAAEFAPDVVLLDIGLPGMDGYEVARQLRAMPALAGAFLVAMSGYGSDEDRARARLAGFDEYLVKPADHNLLRAWLRSRA